MRKILLSILCFLLFFSCNLNAGPAYPKPVSITQPDGTVITVSIHGDEFLNWITCEGVLVALGEDGFYHYASFDSDGNSVPTVSKVGSSSGTVQSSRLSAVPPQSAIDKANAKRAEVMAHTSGLSRIVRRSNSSSSSSMYRSSSIGKTKVLVILVDFKDRKFSAKGGGESARQLFDDMLNKDGFSEYNSVGSVTQYYRDNSLGVFQPEFDVYGPYTVDGNASSFTADDGTTQKGAPLLLAKGCALADNDIDFSQYDQDGDGVIDNVNMIFPGYSAAQGASNTIWPHRWSVYSSYYFDGVRLCDYSCSSEFKGTSGTDIDGIGTFCHEFGHIIGLPDVYDTDYSENGQGTHLGKYSLMASGSYNQDGRRPPYLNAEERSIVGWISGDELRQLDLSIHSYSLTAIHTNKAYKSLTQNEGEYFLYEFRDATGWDTGLDKGLVIYHVDRSDNSVGSSTAKYLWTDNQINCYSSHQCMELERATGSYYPFGYSVHEFTSSTSPAAKDWAGRATGYDLTDIDFTEQSATFLLAASGISGTVNDNSGNPIAGASVYASSLIEPSGEGPRFSATAVTNKRGFYFIPLDDGDMPDYLAVTAMKNGYCSVTSSVEIASSSVKADFNLRAFDDIPDVTLQKYENNLLQSVKGGEDSKVLYAALKYSESELKPYQGYKVKSMSVKINTSVCKKVELVIYVDGKSIFTRDVTSVVKDGSLTAIDLSDADVWIPTTGSMTFAYKVSSDKTFNWLRYPCVIDLLKDTSKDSMYSLDGVNWTDYNYYFIISAGIQFADELNKSGVNYIADNKSSYSEGDKLVLKLVKSEITPYKSITWEVNSQTMDDGSGIVLSKGVTLIKATVKYENGRVEVLERKIKIE